MLVIKDIELVNFTKFTKSKFEFDDGNNAIIANNGAGKSSILNAVGIALFNSSQSSLNKLVKYGALNAEIILNFTYQNDSFSVTRKFGKSSEAVLLKNGEILKVGVTDVYLYLSLLLGNLDDMYKNILYISSNNLVYPFLMDNTSRKKHFDAILGVDEYHKVWERLRLAEKELSNEKIRLETTILNLTNLIGEFSIEKGTQLNSELDNILKEQDEYLANRDVILRKGELKNKISELESQARSIIKAIEATKTKINSLEKGYCYTCNQPLLDNRLQIEQECKLKLESLESELNISIQTKHLFQCEYDAIPQIRSLKDRSYEIGSLRTILDVFRANEVRYNERLTNLTQLKLELEVITSKLKTLTVIRNGVRKLPELIVESITTQISNNASSTLSILMGIFVSVIFNSQYDTLVIFDDREMEFSQLSEGEKVMTAISIRLAIIDSLTSLGIVFLDEPTINLSESVRERLAEKLMEIRYNQMFVISHDNTFSNYVDNVLRLG